MIFLTINYEQNSQNIFVNSDLDCNIPYLKSKTVPGSCTTSKLKLNQILLKNLMKQTVSTFLKWANNAKSQPMAMQVTIMMIWLLLNKYERYGILQPMVLMSFFAEILIKMPEKTHLSVVSGLLSANNGWEYLLNFYCCRFQDPSSYGLLLRVPTKFLLL